METKEESRVCPFCHQQFKDRGETEFWFDLCESCALDQEHFAWAVWGVSPNDEEE